MSGKLAILGMLIQQEKPFSMAMVMEETGASRQLVKQHLDDFVGQGFLERKKNEYNGHVRYIVVDKEKLVTTFVTTGNLAGLGSKAFDTVFIQQGFHLEELNYLINYIRVARALHVPYSLDLRTAVLEDINDTITSLRCMKKGIVENATAYNKALNALKENTNWRLQYEKLLKAFDVESRDYGIIEKHIDTLSRKEA